MKRNTIPLTICAFLLAATTLAGCSGSSDSSQRTSSYSGSTNMAAQAFASSDSTLSSYIGEPEEEALYSREEYSEEPPLDNESYAEASEAPAASPVSANRMIITTIHLQMQTMEFDKGVNEIESLVQSFGGFVQDSYVEGKGMFDQYASRSASFTVRVPSARLDEFIGGVGGIFHITSKQHSGQDITESYHDNEARLNSLKIQEQRLLEMLENAEELQYLIEVQRELSDVQYQIDSYTSSKLRMEQQVAMSTVYMNLSEVFEFDPVDPTPVTFGERFGHTLSETGSNFVIFLQDLVLFLVRILPFLLFLAVLAAVVVVIVLAATRKSRRRRKEWKMERKSMAPAAPKATTPEPAEKSAPESGNSQASDSPKE